MAANPYQDIESGPPGTIGWRIHYFAELASTQECAAELAAAGAAQGTAVIAEAQTAGRGRMGRRWHSPSGANLYVTIVLRPTLRLAEVPGVSLMAGVAVAQALETVAPGLVGLKWPNDAWLRGKKTGGIIAEAISDPHQHLQCVLLGIGLNLNLEPDQIPHELRERATSVLIETGVRCDRIALARTLFSRLNTSYMRLQESGFGAIKPLWESYSALSGKRVAVVDGAARDTGVVKGIDADGSLLLQTDAGLKRIIAGDVTIEGAYS